jgi:hypothetical protein
MTDIEIMGYIKTNNYKINAQEFVLNVLNTSPQILDTIYNSENKMMTIITPDNKFAFEWVLGRY